MCLTHRSNAGRASLEARLEDRALLSGQSPLQLPSLGLDPASYDAGSVLVRFLRRTYVVVARGRETEHLDVDAALVRLLAGR